MSTHRIRRQRWELRAATPADAFAVRRRLREAWEPELLPAFERAFDRAAADDAVIHIPRIELRLAVASEEELASLLPGLIEAGIAEWLRDRPHPAAPAASDAEPATPLATLLHYLRTGSLPWWGAGDSFAAAAGELRRWCRDEHTRVLAMAAEERASAAFHFRFLQLLDDPARSLPATLPRAWRDALVRLLTPSSAAPTTHTRLWIAAELLARSATAPADAPLPDPAPLAGPNADAEERAAARTLLASIPGAAPEWSARTRIAEGSAGASHAPHSPDPAAVEAAEAPMSLTRPDVGARRDASLDAGADAGASTDANTDTHATARTHATAQAPASTRASVTRIEHAAPETPEEHHDTAVAHAGLILLHPYIVPLLTNTGITQGKELDPHSVPRAAALLHYLASGAEPYEYELGLIKVLLAHDGPIPTSAGLLKPGDAEEADALLAAVISHWSVLRGTTISGLRASFLSRPGLLARADDGWRLRVEPAGYDVLLDHLPWGFATARLPWMPRPVHTEWRTH